MAETQYGVSVVKEPSPTVATHDSDQNACNRFQADLKPNQSVSERNIKLLGIGSPSSSGQIVDVCPREAGEAPRQWKGPPLVPRGVLGLGIGDHLSQSAAMAQSSMPLVAHARVQGAYHPSTFKGLPPHKLKLIQQQLILLLHAQRCTREVKKVPCSVPYCNVMKNTQRHLRGCKLGAACTFSLCSSSRRILGHWKVCKSQECPVCSRLRNVAISVRLKLLLKKQEKQEYLVPNPDVGPAFIPVKLINNPFYKFLPPLPPKFQVNPAQNKK